MANISSIVKSAGHAGRSPLSNLGAYGTATKTVSLLGAPLTAGVFALGIGAAVYGGYRLLRRLFDSYSY